MVMCCTSLHFSSGFASSTRAMTPAAMGALALVPVWPEVQPLWRSVVITFRSPLLPLL